MLTINHTTSKKATEQEVCSAEHPQTGERLYLKVSWGRRKWKNRCAYALYKVTKAYYTAIYFYYLPFMATLTGLLVQINYRMNAVNTCE